MEVGNPPAPMMTAPAPLNTTPGVRVCSESHCNAIMGRSSRGNLCEQCVMKVGSGTFPNARKPQKEGVPGERSTYAWIDRMGVKKERPTSVAHMAGTYRGNPAATRPGNSHYNPHQRPVNLYSSTQMLRVPSSVVSERPIIGHFNSQGEVIQDVYQQVQLDQEAFFQQTNEQTQIASSPCLRCLRSVPWHCGEGLCPSCRMELAAPPSLEGATLSSGHPLPVENEPSVDTNVGIVRASSSHNGEDIDMEHSYYLGSNDEEKLLVNHIPNGRLVAPTQVKRRKVSHPDVIDLTRSEEAGLSAFPAPDAPSKPISPLITSKETRMIPEPHAISTKYTIQCLKLCSTSDCTGIIAADSSAIRCLTCVQQEWKSKRSALRETPKSSRSLKRKKVVTWADEVASKGIPEPESPKSPVSFVVDTDSTENATSIVTGVPPKSSSITEGRLARLLETRPSIQKHQFSAPQDANASKDSPSSSNQEICAPSVTEHNPYELCHSDSEASPALKVISTVGTSGDGYINSGHLSGWDSELSELSSSSEQEDQDSASSDSEAGSTQAPLSSALKIRIPARPAGIYSRNCISLKCDQLLSSNYRWKSCVMCRARNRDYQRRRQNLQGRHDRLDKELKQAQLLGTSAFLSNDTGDSEEDAVLTPGARLCAVKDCPFIIPPLSEYRWKTCALCRFWKQARRERPDGEEDRLPCSHNPLHKSSSKSDRRSVLKLLDVYRNKDSVRNEGRCQSIDCGMLVPDSSSPRCKQCLARRAFIMDGDKSLCGSKTSTESMRKSQRQASYVQYKCFSALLSEFKERLFGFLQSQSVFSLFRKPNAGKALFAFDGEYSVVALDLNVVGRKEEIDANVLQLKREIEHVGRIRFSPKRLVTVLDEGIVIRFSCIYSVPILQSTSHADHTSISTIPKHMQCEMEIIVLPDHSHRFIPGQRTAIRFRLFG